MITTLKNIITLITTVTAVLIAAKELKKAYDGFRRSSEENSERRGGEAHTGNTRDRDHSYG